jgi:hypothetical protein
MIARRFTGSLTALALGAIAIAPVQAAVPSAQIARHAGYDAYDSAEHRGRGGYRYRRGGDAGDVLAGLLILGTIAVVADAAFDADRERDERYRPRPDWRGDDGEYRSRDDGWRDDDWRDDESWRGADRDYGSRDYRSGSDWSGDEDGDGEDWRTDDDWSGSEYEPSARSPYRSGPGARVDGDLETDDRPLWTGDAAGDAADSYGLGEVAQGNQLPAEAYRAARQRAGDPVISGSVDGRYSVHSVDDFLQARP